MQFWFVTVIPAYLNFATFLKESFATVTSVFLYKYYAVWSGDETWTYI
jgi:hypothetical protein